MNAIILWMQYQFQGVSRQIYVLISLLKGGGGGRGVGIGVIPQAPFGSAILTITERAILEPSIHLYLVYIFGGNMKISFSIRYKWDYLTLARPKRVQKAGWSSAEQRTGDVFVPRWVLDQQIHQQLYRQGIQDLSEKKLTVSVLIVSCF